MYKWCGVRTCKNTSIKTPEKLFVNVPKKPKMRKLWLKLAGRNPDNIKGDSTIFLCEDHFDMEKDMANYLQYKMGFSQNILMEVGVVPSKFNFQQEPKKSMCDPSTSRSGFVKRQRTQLIQECQDTQPFETMRDVRVTSITKERWEIPIKTEPETDLEVPEELLQIKEEPLDSDGEERRDIHIKTEPELDLDVHEELLQVKEEDGEGNSAVLLDPLTQSEDRRFCCHHCGYRTAEFNILKEHILAREGNECPASCPHCTFSCAEPSSMKAHLLIIHGDPRALFCPHCDFRCALPSPLKWHIHVRHESKGRYSRPDRHILAHHKSKKPYSCPHCNYRSTWSSDLKSHIMARHEGKRPYSCPHCDYTSSWPSNLKSHILARHEGKRPYSCPRCVYTFAWPHCLKNHIQAVHEGKQPYSCPLCDYTCAHAFSMKRHIQRRH